MQPPQCKRHDVHRKDDSSDAYVNCVQCTIYTLYIHIDIHLRFKTDTLII